jgi:hypothetical protein
MIPIRTEQMDALNRHMEEDFVERMTAHLRRFFPNWARVSGEQGVVRTIRLGIERARSYRITAERDVSRYIDVMAVLGEDFDKEAWAAGILNRNGSGAVRMNLVFDAAKRRISERAFER